MPEAMLPSPQLRLITALFLGTALSISSVKIVAAVVRDMDAMRRTCIGQLIVALGDHRRHHRLDHHFPLYSDWPSTAEVEIAPLGLSVLGTLAFLGVQPHHWAAAGVPRDPLVERSFRQRAAGDHRDPGHHGRDGAGHRPDRRAHRPAWRLCCRHPCRPLASILTEHVRDQLRGPIVALFMPVFFGIAGLGADLTVLRDPTLLLVAGGLIVIASARKIRRRLPRRPDRRAVERAESAGPRLPAWETRAGRPR